MPHITRKAFAAFCGEDEKKINVYIARVKISPLATNKKLIDTDNPLNKEFIAKSQKANFLDKGQKAPKLFQDAPEKAKTEQKTAKNVKKEPKTEEKPKKASIEPREIRQKIEAQNAVDQRRVDQDRAQKDQAMAFTDLKIQREQLLLAKSAGKLLPVDLAEGVIKRHGVTFMKEFEKGVEQLADMYCNIMAGGDPRMRVRVVEAGKKLLERCITEAGAKADEEIDSLVQEYSDSLLRGQKKV